VGKLLQFPCFDFWTKNVVDCPPVPFDFEKSLKNLLTDGAMHYDTIPFFDDSGRICYRYGDQIIRPVTWNDLVEKYKPE
jgi:hypothetical protein